MNDIITWFICSKYFMINALFFLYSILWRFRRKEGLVSRYFSSSNRELKFTKGLKQDFK